MILFYEKTTGKIVGTIGGRLHNEAHLKMWIGDKDTTERLVIQWKQVGWYDKNGKKVDRDAVDEEGKNIVAAVEWAPEHEQPDIIEKLDANIGEVYHYKIDPKTKQFTHE